MTELPKKLNTLLKMVPDLLWKGSRRRVAASQCGPPNIDSSAPAEPDSLSLHRDMTLPLHDVHTGILRGYKEDTKMYQALRKQKLKGRAKGIGFKPNG